MAYLNSGDNREHLLTIRRDLCCSLHDQIPSRFGIKNEKFRENRKNKIKQFNETLEEFDNKHFITESELKNNLEIYRF